MQKYKGVGFLITGILVLIVQQMLFPTMYFIIPIGGTMESVLGSSMMTIVAGILIAVGIMRLRQ